MSGLQAVKRLGKCFWVRSFVDKNFQIHHWVGKHIIKKLVPRERGWELGRGTESNQANAHCWQSSQNHFRVIQQGNARGQIPLHSFWWCKHNVPTLYTAFVFSFCCFYWQNSMGFLLLFFSNVSKIQRLALSSSVYSQRQKTSHSFGWCWCRWFQK